MSAPPDPASFTFEPLFAVLGAAAAVIYARAARIHRPGGWRIASFAAGIALIVLSVNSPLETLAVHYLLMAHLAQNALMADIAPLLVLLGLNQAMWEAAEARFPVIERVIAAWPLLLMLWLAAWYGVHFAPAYQYALRKGAYVIESPAEIVAPFQRAGFEVNLVDEGGGQAERQADRPSSTAGLETYRMRLVASRR